ncbi:MAG: hypothetical protein PQJ61_03330 [Spirochaetales bacterium]|uniref:Outer membrane protein beta-barrel domain-containing protein n=1 Tax=Candidatus Thalassospirochaeta sargassi TaxID=3119039 RepID=A0AAJ1IE54_9SPIO|nr:hypothetical protein [Spirochaetales bacterium]
MKKTVTAALLFLFLSASAAFALDLTIAGPPDTVLKLVGGGELFIDASGELVISGLEPGDSISFTAISPGRYPGDYSVEMGTLSKTYRIEPSPTGVIAGELKFTDSGFCPAFGVEMYFKPENAYLSFDIYQSYISLTQMFSGSYDVSSRYFMPMLGVGFYAIPYDSILRLNFGFSAGMGFGNNLPNPLFVSEFSAGLEVKFLDHYIIFGEINPRLHSALSGGWDAYSDIYGDSRSGNMYSIGSWSIYGFPCTNFGVKYKY